MKVKLHNSFLIPVIIVMSLDVLFTVIGQPANYWSSSYRVINEGSSIGYYLLGYSPWIFLGSMAVYIASMVVLMKKLPLFWSVILAMALFIGHIGGSASWAPYVYLKLGMTKFQFFDWYVRLGYEILIVIVTVLIVWPEIKKSN